jgi:hypothetical protein
MSWYDIISQIPFVAGVLVGAGLFLLIALLAVIAFFWDSES